jgi:DNA-binding response OmpR family regulator
VLSRDLLLTDVWGYQYTGGTRTVDVHIRRLRAKLGEEHANLIQTVRSVGYSFGQSRWSV